MVGIEINDSEGTEIKGMKQRRFDHIDLRVKNRAIAQNFYEKILPALGFTLEKSDDEWGTFYAETNGVPTEFFGFTED